MPGGSTFRELGILEYCLDYQEDDIGNRGAALGILPWGGT